MTKSTNGELSPDSDDRLIEAAKRQALDGDSGSSSPAGESTETLKDSVAPPKMPKEIGRYHVKRVIASGGMGTVYEAIQEHPRRTVAVKVMKHGIASRSAMRRFEYESQILARLRHPGIAQVFEAGTHDDPGAPGEPVPFFAMEYIPNAKPITQYAQEKKFGTRERLGLFGKVCDAVHHGHQKGIIHRDLKPGNILVDSHGQPRIIDFGVARATDSDLAVTTLQTDVGQLIGTMQYMSPEQCEADPHDLDIRSDVYALGVVLYELLCRKLPYDVSKVAVYEATRMVREHQPTRLSTIDRNLRGDVETIVFKALEKDRERRYQSAIELQQDIKRYLTGEAIIARPPSIVYQLRVFARRNKAFFSAVAAAFVVLVAGVIVSTSLYVRSEAARREAIQARSVAEEARESEAEQRSFAESERDRAAAAEQQALRERSEARRQAYLANIAAAHAALSTNELATVRRCLDAAPAEHRNWEWAYLFAESDTSLAVMHGHHGLISSITFSPDGSRLASASWDGTVRMWDVATGKQLSVLRGHEGEVYSVAFSPDGSQLASASEDKIIRFWDAINGVELGILEGHNDSVYDVAFSPDGARVASGSTDTTVRLWNARTREELLVLRGHEDHVDEVVFSPDGTRLASVSDDRTVRLWDALSGKELAVLEGHEGETWGVAFHPDGTRVASASEDSTVRIWSTSTYEELGVLRAHSEGVTSLAFSPNGTRLASGSSDKTVRVWESATDSILAVMRGHEDWVMSVAFSPDGTRLASASGSWVDMPGNNTIRLWDASFSEELDVVRGHEDWVCSVAFSPDGKRLASASGWRGALDNTARLWDAATGELLAILRGHEHPVRAAAFSPDGALLVSASWDRTLRLWDTSSGRELAVLIGHDDGINSAAFSPDGGRLASASNDKTLRLWEMSTGRELVVMRGHESHVSSVSFSPDGARLASASADSTVRVWDAFTGEELAVLRGHGDDVESVIFSPDGRRLASASDDATIRLWDASTGKQQGVLKGHEVKVYSAAFSPDGTRLASASADFTVRMWDTATGRELMVLRGDKAGVLSVAFSPDGTRLASGSMDKTMRVWHSVPYRVRFLERQSVLAARPEAEDIVDGLWQQSTDAKTIAERLREDASLSEPLRRAALNVLLEQSAQLQEELHTHLKTLYARLVFTADVVAALKADNSLAADVRDRAIRKARLRGDTPFRLHQDSWNLVHSAGGDPDAHPIGLRGAEAAVAAQPDDIQFLITLALAQYRNERYQEACAAMTRVDELSWEESGASRPKGVAVLTMALFRLGRIEEAQARFAQLKGMMHGGRDAYKPATALFEECKQLLEGSSTQTRARGDTEGRD